MGKLGLLKKTCIILAVLEVLASAALAQTFTNLFSFDQTDGSGPNSLIQAADGNFYGTSGGGGSSTNCSSGCGTVFQITPEGVLTTIHSFDSTDGSGPSAMIQATDGNFYGITQQGGAFGYGTVFKITPEGALTTLYSFCSQANCADGEQPADLMQATDGNFYGTTSTDGVIGYGTVFTITPEGILTTLHRFIGPDGVRPTGVIQATDGKFYGTTSSGGTYGYGTVFQITSAGDLTSLYSFCARAGCPDGWGPQARLIQAKDGSFYGVTNLGGAHHYGTVFSITGTGTLQTLYSFCAQTRCRDGASPLAGLIQATDRNFYGVTYSGGAYQFGTVFEMGNGAMVTLHSFDLTDGAYPEAGLIQATDRSFYGTTTSGGAYRAGSILRMVVMPPAVTLSPTSLSFGYLALGETSATKTIWLKNSGTALLDINSIALSDENNFGWSSPNCGIVLAKSQRCNLLVTFAPQTLGKLTASFTFTDNASNSPQTVVLSGIAVEPATLAPASAAYPARVVGTTSLPRTFTLTNNQTVGLNSIAISTSGDFAVSATTCTTNLAAKSKCTINVTFTPTKTGTRTGSLSVSDSASNSPQASSLTGTGN
jgi:uncharacterized repeat protein (TIGR03803 family)